MISASSSLDELIRVSSLATAASRCTYELGSIVVAFEHLSAPPQRSLQPSTRCSAYCCTYDNYNEFCTARRNTIGATSVEDKIAAFDVRRSKCVFLLIVHSLVRVSLFRSCSLQFWEHVIYRTVLRLPIFSLRFAGMKDQLPAAHAAAPAVRKERTAFHLIS